MSAPAGAVNRLLPAGRYAEDLATHLKVFGARPRLSSETMLGELERSGLLGRGGAGFPAVLKWRAAAERAKHDDGAVVVADAVESEPASFKDKALLALRPHLVLDGLQLAAEGIGATRAIVYISRSSDALVRTLTAAVAERARELDPGLSVEVVTSPTRYVAGEETAVVNRLNGRAARPNAVPPRPYESGVGGLPTLLHNVETLAHVALIARFGAAWFRSAGSPASPGTTLVTVSGAVRTPGVHEVDYDETVGDIVERAGGVSSEPAAVLLGGYFGRWVDAAVAWPVRIEAPALRRIQAGLGAGVIAILPRGVCGVAESDRVLSFLARESAGQCGPCQFGLPAMAESLHAVAEGRARPQALEQLTRWAEEIRGRGACRHPDGAALFVTSALRVFGDDVRRHVRDGPCPGARREPILPTPVLPSGWR